MVDHPLTRSAVPDRHLQRRHDQFGSAVIGHGPADHAAAEDIQDHGQIKEALVLRRHVGDVGDPERIGGGRRERALDQVRGRLGRRIAPRGLERAPAMGALQTGTAHETGPSLAPAMRSRRRRLRMHARHAIGPPARLVDGADLHRKPRIGLGPHARPVLRPARGLAREGSRAHRSTRRAAHLHRLMFVGQQPERWQFMHLAPLAPHHRRQHPQSELLARHLDLADAAQ